MPDQTQTLTTVAEEILTDHLRYPVRITSVDALKTDKNYVARCYIDNINRDTPASVIVKQSQRNDKTTDSTTDAFYWFLNEWAGLEFLTGLPSTFTFGPRLLASRQDQHMIILEDLGDHPSLQDILFDDTTPVHVGEKALIDLAVYLGQMHAATAGKQHELETIRTMLGSFTPPVEDSSRDIRQDIPALQAFLTSIGLNPPSHFYTELESAQAAIHNPGPFQTYVHGDAAPHNFVYIDSHLKLIDFEFARFNHALVDMVCLRMAFPSAYRGRHAPPYLVSKFEAAYRAELHAQIPAAADDTLFQLGVVQACAHWTFSKIVPGLDVLRNEIETPGAIYTSQSDVTPEQATYGVQSYITYLRAFIDTAQTFDHLATTYTVLQSLLDVLQNHWPDVKPFPYYPIFQSADRNEPLQAGL